MDKIILYEEYRLIEKSESEINGAWKRFHLLLFFLASIFGLFCTFFFYMLTYLFQEKCILFPKLLSLRETRHSIIYSFIQDKEVAESLPVDFVSAQWADQSECYLPLYVPLLSAICGLIWTAMFLMCSSGSRKLTGMQRPYRILPIIFIISISMGGLCIHASIKTQDGLSELCNKLGEITGNPGCSYAANVATLAYQRRIRGVYQAIRMTTATAWVHTACWLLSAVLVVLRVILVIDFHLVRIQAELRGDMDKMLEQYERHIRTVYPMSEVGLKYNSGTKEMTSPVQSEKEPHKTFSTESVKIHFQNESYFEDCTFVQSQERASQVESIRKYSTFSLVPEEFTKLQASYTYAIRYTKIDSFVAGILYDILNDVLNYERDKERRKTLIIREYDVDDDYLNIFNELSSTEITFKKVMLDAKPAPQSNFKTNASQIPEEETPEDVKNDQDRVSLKSITSTENERFKSLETLTTILNEEDNTVDYEIKKIQSSLKSSKSQTDPTKRKSNVRINDEIGTEDVKDLYISLEDASKDDENEVPSTSHQKEDRHKEKLD